MRAVSLLVFFLFTFTTNIPAQDLFPVVRAEGCDSLTPGGECRGYFDFVNNTVRAVTVRHCKTGGLIQVHPQPSDDSILPGDTSRVRFEVNKRAYSGRFEMTIDVVLSDGSIVSQTFRYYNDPASYSAEGLGPCNCNKGGGPEFEDGNKVYTDSLLAITLRHVRPDSLGRCEFKLHIPPSGIPDGFEVTRSVDPRFEAEMAKHIAEPGIWIPMCTKTPEPGYENCRGLRPMGCYVFLSVEIKLD